MSVDFCGPRWLQPLAEKFHISWLNRATHVVLTGHNYTDAVIDDLCRLKHLKTISLMDTKISAGGLAKLKRSLPDCEIKS